MSRSKEIMDIPKRGNVLPNPDLRKSLQGAEKCKAFFEEKGLLDYLGSINKYYLEGKGEIVGPQTRISSSVQEEENPGELRREGFELSNSWGGVLAYLKWDKNNERKSKGFLTLRLFLNHGADWLNHYYQLSISASEVEHTDETGTVSITGSIYRIFRLDPADIRSNDLDDILLSFTNELVKANIL